MQSIRIITDDMLIDDNLTDEDKRESHSPTYLEYLKYSLQNIQSREDRSVYYISVTLLLMVAVYFCLL